MEIFERIKQIRVAKGLTQAEFAAKIGIGQAAISAIEKGIRGITDRNIELICKEYNVSEAWLRTGDGAMFIESGDSAFARFAREHNLDDVDEAILRAYVGLPKEQRRAMHNMILGIADAYMKAPEASISVGMAAAVQAAKNVTENKKSPRPSSAGEED